MRAFTKDAQRQQAVAPEICNRNAGDGLVVNAGGWRSPDPATLIKTSTVQAGDLRRPALRLTE